MPHGKKPLTRNDKLFLTGFIITGALATFAVLISLSAHDKFGDRVQDYELVSSNDLEIWAMFSPEKIQDYNDYRVHVYLANGLTITAVITLVITVLGILKINTARLEEWVERNSSL